jgi:REP element-mobilizing transposase RayT
MAHSYSSILMHCIFSTKDRQRLITPELAAALHPYIGGIARTNGMRALTVGGVEDHVHVLLSLPATMPVARGIQLIKGGSSKWVHETMAGMGGFAWQEGYGAFSIGVSQVDRTRRCIEGQTEHHRTVTFQEEFIGFLERHGIEYDPRYIRS